MLQGRVPWVRVRRVVAIGMFLGGVVLVGAEVCRASPANWRPGQAALIVTVKVMLYGRRGKGHAAGPDRDSNLVLVPDRNGAFESLCLPMRS